MTHDAPTLAGRRADNEAKQESFRARMAEIEDAIGANESARGRAVAAGDAGAASALRREARELEQERDDLSAALGHLTAEAGELEEEHRRTQQEEASAALRAAKADFDRDLDAAAAAIRAFHERELAALLARVDAGAERVRRCERDVSRQGVGSGFAASYLGQAWNRVAPLYPLIQDLRAYIAGKPIIRGVPPRGNVSVSASSGGVETVASGDPASEAPLALR